MHSIAADVDDGRGAQGLRPHPQGGRAGEEHVRARPAVAGCTTGRPRAPIAFLQGEVRDASPRSSRRQPRGVPGRLELRRDRPRTSRSPTRSSPAAARRRAPTATSPATSRCPTAWSPRRSSPTLPLFLGSYPITPASDILHELCKHKRFGVRTFQAEDEIAGIGAALGAAFGGALGVTTTSGPGVALKSETIGLAVSLELPLRRRRRPARRPVDRPADQDRAVRPAAGDVRPQRRGAGADRRAAARRPTASTPRSRRPGSRTTYRTPVFLLSDGYLANGSEPWRIPDGRRPARPRASRSPTAPNHTLADGTDVFWPYLRDPRDAGPPVGRARHAGPRAPHRRHREGRRHRQHLLRPGQPRPHGPHPRRPRSTASRVDPAARGRRPRRRRAGCWCSAGARRTARSAPPCRPGAPSRASTSRRRTCATSTRSRRNTGEVLRRYDKVLVPEMNLGQLALLLRGEVPGRRHRLQPGPRPAVQGRRARRRHRGRSSTTNGRRHRRRHGASRSHRASPRLRLRAARPTRRRRPRTSSPTRRCAGAPAAVTTRSSPRSRASCPSWGCARENIVFVSGIGCSSPLPVLHEHLRHALDPRPRPGDRDRPGRPRGRTCRCGSSPVTATRCRSAATT